MKDLFEISTGSLISSKKLKSGNCPRISVKNFDNGVYGMFDTKNISDARHHKNFITVNFFGNAFYHPYEASIEMKVHALKLKNKEFTSATGLFITSVINYSLKNKFSYGDQLSSSDLKNLNIKIKIPTKDGNIDFEFMEKFITELEAERITELEAYLSATGLKDTVLTDEEKFAVENLNSRRFEKFLLKDLFEINSYKKRFDANKVKLTENIGHPYIVRQGDNNGQKGFINEDSAFLNDGNTISFGQDTATIFYQAKPYFTGDKIKILHSKTDKFRKENALFFISAMNKAFSNFSWGSSRFDVETLKSQKIYLPITSDGEIDFEFMEKFISAVQKIIIADVVKYGEEKISAYRQAANKNF